MLTKHRSGTTAFNNGLTLPQGMLSYDVEKHALRVHDGATPGGFECVGQRAFTPQVGPGPETLVAGTMDHGFFGEVSGAELIGYVDLATSIGLVAGTPINDAESTWLKFALDGKILYVAKKPVRHSLRWQELYQAGAVYGDDTVGTFPAGTPRTQDARITVGTASLKVRLLTGSITDPSANVSGYDVSTTHGSEWNRLMYHVASGTSATSTHSLASEGITEGSFAQYSEAELGTHRTVEGGSYNFTLTTHGYAEDYCTTRAGYGVSRMDSRSKLASGVLFSWRPVLELEL